MKCSASSRTGRERKQNVELEANERAVEFAQKIHHNQKSGGEAEDRQARRGCGGNCVGSERKASEAWGEAGRGGKKNEREGRVNMTDRDKRQRP